RGVHLFCARKALAIAVRLYIHAAAQNKPRAREIHLGAIAALRRAAHKAQGLRIGIVPRLRGRKKNALFHAYSSLWLAARPVRAAQHAFVRRQYAQGTVSCGGESTLRLSKISFSYTKPCFFSTAPEAG